MNSVDISGDEFEFGIDILLTTVIVNGDPSTNISFGFLLIESEGIIGFPPEPSRSIGYFTVGVNSIFAEHLPVESGYCKESIGE